MNFPALFWKISNLGFLQKIMKKMRPIKSLPKQNSILNTYFLFNFVKISSFFRPFLHCFFVVFPVNTNWGFCKAFEDWNLRGIFQEILGYIWSDFFVGGFDGLEHLKLSQHSAFFKLSKNFLFKITFWHYPLQARFLGHGLVRGRYIWGIARK